jgi:HEAT repeat protein
MRHPPDPACRDIRAPNTPDFPIMEQLSPQVMHRLVFAVLMQHLPETQTGPALQLLTDALSHSQNQVRELAIVAISELPASPVKRVAALAPALKDASPRVRRRAARAIGDQGNAAQAVLAQLMTGLRDADASVRRDCAGALGRLGVTAAASGPLLVNMLSDGETRTRAVVAVALKRMGRATIPAMLNGLFHSDENVRQRCATLLTEMAPDEPRVLAALAASGVKAGLVDEAMLAVRTPPPGELPSRLAKTV